MGLRIRRFREEDLEAVLEVERASFDEPYGKEVFRRVLSEENIFLVGEVEGGIVVAYILVLIRRLKAHVLSVAVHPKWRGRGYARELFENLFRQVRLLGLERVVLEVDVTNNTAQHVYYALGFKVGGRLKRYYQNGHDALLLFKELDP
jgi:ribosomal-protein-alanine N-acetyltransferase